ncbi:hypothetical protein [Desulfobacula toluolica]|uniref:Uncharacterized protein n=1 Tax=Desulfobacula toluolica (strain DSM 7467 / Tol2) TaxID=651182 RepID=K0NGY1_DESTT|nr:hypothetical protein [Desulfobacula toluolica]CCK80206.1 uncharacterized protein TOL2_C20450 [Desulfobacula toluolica Tol2]CCK80220.1 uncharacterized protein TOL2_C20590 [Desulfobacula toluolica Tol2]
MPFASIWLGLGLALTSIKEDAGSPLRRVPCPAHIGIGPPITEEPSHTTGHTDRVSGGSADQAD